METPRPIRRSTGALPFVGLQRVSANPVAAAALDRAPFLFAHPAPDAGVLTGLQCPLEALVDGRTAPADRLCLLHLQQGRTGCPDGEEQLRVLISAGGTVAPVHGGNTP